MAFSHLLQKAPYYNPAGLSTPNSRSTPRAAAPGSTTASRYGAGVTSTVKRAPRTSLVDPYASLSARDFDTFVDDVSSKIKDALSYDAHAEARVRRGYEEDEEYWLEMGGRPGQFLNGALEKEVEQGTVEKDAVIAGADLPAAPASEDMLEADQTFEGRPVGPEQVLDFARLQEAPQTQGADVIDPALFSSDDRGEDALAATTSNPLAGTTQTVPGLYPPLAPLLQDNMQDNTNAPPFSLQVTPHLPIQTPSSYPVGNGDVSQFAGSTSVPDLAFEPEAAEPLELYGERDDTASLGVRRDTTEGPEEDIQEAVEGILREDELENRLDEELEGKLEEVLHEDLQAEGGPWEDDSEATSPMKERSESAVIEIGSSSEDEDEEEEEDDEEDEQFERQSFDEGDTGEEDGNDVHDSPIEHTRQPHPPLQAPVPSQARLLKERTRLRLDAEAQKASGYDSENEEDDEDEEMLEDEEDDEEAMLEFREMRRRMRKERSEISAQDAEDRYFEDDGGSELIDLSDDYDEEQAEENEEAYDSTSSHGTAASNRNKRKWSAELEDELEDDEVFKADREATGTLEERVPIPPFMKKQKNSDEYDLRGDSSSEDEQGEGYEEDDMSVNASEEFRDDVIEVEDAEGEDYEMGTEDVAEETKDLTEEEGLAMLSALQQQLAGQIPRQSDVIDVDYSTQTKPSTGEEAKEVESPTDMMAPSQSAGDNQPIPDDLAALAAESQQDIQTMIDSVMSGFPTAHHESSLRPSDEAAFQFVTMGDSSTPLFGFHQNGQSSVSASPSPFLSLDPSLSGTHSPSLESFLANFPSSVILSSGQPMPSIAQNPATAGGDGLAATGTAELRSNESASIDEPLLQASTVSEAISRIEPNAPAEGQTIAATDDDGQLSSNKDASFYDEDLAAQTESSSVDPSKTSPLAEALDTQPLPDQPRKREALAGASAAEAVEASSTTQTSPANDTDVPMAASENVPEKTKEVLHTSESSSLEPAVGEDTQVYREKSEGEKENLAVHTVEPEVIGTSTATSDATMTIADDDHTHQPQASMKSAGEAAIEKEPVKVSNSVDEESASSPAERSEQTSDNGQPAADDLEAPHVEKEGATSQTKAADASTENEDIQATQSRENAPEDMVEGGQREEETEAGDTTQTNAPMEVMDPETSSGTDPSDPNRHQDIEETPGSPDFDAESLIAKPDEQAERRAKPTSPGLEGEEADASKPHVASTPKRILNAILPGAWDPSTPIRFGGQSLEAAVREAAYDPERSGELKKSLGYVPAKAEGVDQDDAKVGNSSAGPKIEPVSITAQSSAFNTKEQQEISAPDYIPLDVESPGQEEGEEEGPLAEAIEVREASAAAGEREAASSPKDAVTGTMEEESSLPEVSVIRAAEAGEAFDGPARRTRSRSRSKTPSRNQNNGSSLLPTTPERARRSVSPNSHAKYKASETNAHPQQDGVPQTKEAEPPQEYDHQAFPSLLPPAISLERGRATTSKQRTVVDIDVGNGGTSADEVDETEVASLLVNPSKPRLHRHGGRGGNSSEKKRRRSTSTSRASSAAPVHPDSVHEQVMSSPSSAHRIQTRSQCVYHKLSVPTVPSTATATATATVNESPSRRFSTRLARALDPNENTLHPYVFLVPACVTADRQDKMHEAGMTDLGPASVQEEGLAMRMNEDDDTASTGVPEEVLQSLRRIVGQDLFREGEVELLAPLPKVQKGARTDSVPAQGPHSEKKRKRESDFGLGGGTPHKRSSAASPE